MRTLHRAVSVVGAGVVVSALSATGGHAAGFYLQDQSARATGRAYSGEAADQGAASLWWNPASIAGIDRSELDATATGVFLFSKAIDHGSTITRFGRTFPVGGNSSDSDVVAKGFLPSFQAALRLNDQWSIGLGVTSPFSFITQYDAASWTRYAALTSRLETIDIQPTLAWRPTRWLGIGVGPNIEYTLASLSSALPNLSPRLPDATETLHGSGWNVGANVGVQLHLLDERLVFGFAYRSSIDHELGGSLVVAGLQGPLARQNVALSDITARFTTPWSATAALRYRLTPRLTLDAQVVRTGWGDFRSVDVVRPLQISIPEGYSDVTSGAVGLDYAVTPTWVLRAGAQYDPTPTSASRDPRVPDATRLLLALGTTVSVTSRLSVDFGALYLQSGSSHINRNASAYGGTPVSTPIQIRGEVHANGLVVALGTRFQF